MEVFHDLAKTATLIGEPARAAMLWSLLDGQMRPASELAFLANISPQNASAHLAQLVKSGLLTVEPQGRHRYFRLASPEVAQVIECLVSLGQAKVEPLRSTRVQDSELGFARTCYDHLAGRLAVAISSSMQSRGWLQISAASFVITDTGAAGLRAFGIDRDEFRPRRGPLGRACLDWSERKHHVAGPLGAALLQQMLERKWLSRVREGRLIRLLPFGRTELRRHLGVDF